MREKVLKALANPPRIFYVPYSLALLNFLFWFILFVVSMCIFYITTKNIPMWLPIAFLATLSISHMVFGIYSKKEPQLAQIIFSELKLLKNRIPNRLAV